MLVGVACLTGLVAHQLRLNLTLPVARDASIFLFMANNIAHGQAPHWAVPYPKNPLVELYWAAFIGVAGRWASLTTLARLAEHLWVRCSALGLAFVVSRLLEQRAPATSRAERAALAMAAALAYAALVTHLDVVDSGLQLSIYMTLPELAVLALLLRAGSPVVRRTAWVVALGTALFAAWFVKQTALVPAAALVATWIATRGDRRRHLASVALAAVVAALWALAYVAVLALTGTLDNYWWATVEYKAHLARHMPVGVLWQKLVSTLVLPAGIAPFPSAFPVVLLYLLPVAATCWVVGTWRAWRGAQHGRARRAGGRLDHRRDRAGDDEPALFSTLLRVRARPCDQSGLGADRPEAVGAAARGRVPGRHRGDTGGRLPRAPRACDLKDASPIYLTVTELRDIIPPGATVFVWGGLAHYHVETAKPSDYEDNVWWPHIAAGLPDGQRDAHLEAVLRPDPPDYVIELFEDDPAEQGFRPIPLTPALLTRWTGVQYRLLLTTPRRPGRYGMPARLFVRQR